jgi:uncharacterized protein (DUF2062 family)
MIARVTGKIRRAASDVHSFLMHTVLHTDDPPRRLALGAAIGIFVAFTPTFGFQMVLVVFIAWLLRANKAVGLPIVWISNPATMGFIYYVCYMIGCLLLGREPIWQEFMTRLHSPGAGWLPAVALLLQEGSWPFLFGCLAVALGTAIPTYYASYHAIRLYRLRRWGQLVPPSRDESASRV